MFIIAGHDSCVLAFLYYYFLKKTYSPSSLWDYVLGNKKEGTYTISINDYLKLAQDVGGNSWSQIAFNLFYLLTIPYSRYENLEHLKSLLLSMYCYYLTAFWCFIIAITIKFYLYMFLHRLCKENLQHFFSPKEIECRDNEILSYLKFCCFDAMPQR